MKLRSFLILLVVAPFLAFAQNGNHSNSHNNHDNHGDGNSNWNNQSGENGSSLSIFSENGDKFLLIINGIKQNNYPQTKIRIEDLPSVSNDIQIIFADNQTPEIEKRITFLDPIESKAIDLVLKIKRTGNGRAKLFFHKSSELTNNYQAEQGEYCMHYGHDVVVHEVVNTPPPPPVGPVPMDDRSFSDAKTAINSSAFENTKLTTAKTILDGSYVTTNQVIELCNLFTFENNKLDLAKYAYNRTIDKSSYFKVGNVFTFDSNKNALMNFISSNH